MQNLWKQISRAKFRLTTQQFFRQLATWLLIGFSVAVVGTVLPKLWFINIDNQQWTLSWIGISALIALIVSLIMTVVQRPSTLASAIEIDKRFGLKERISSTLHLSPEDQETPIGSALVADAVAKSERLDVRDAFPIGLHKGLMWATIPLGLALASFLLPNAMPPAPVAVKENKINVNQVRESTKVMIKTIQEKREEAEKAGLEEVADQYKKLEEKLTDLRDNEKLDTKQALAKLNDLKKEIEDRKKALGGGNDKARDQFKKNLKELSSGPADKAASAMEGGDMEQAAEEFSKMKDKLMSGELTPEQQQKLSEQMKQMSDALQDAMEKHNEAKEALEEELNKAEQQGDVDKAAKIKQQLDQLEAMEAQIEAMDALGDKMDELSEALKSGDSEAAKALMQEIADKMQEMGDQQEEMDNLQEMLDQLADSKDQMACDQCNGKGCSKCQGEGEGEGDGEGDSEEEGDGDKEGKGKGKGKGKGNAKSKSGSQAKARAQGRGKGNGNGLGDGQGFGDRPEEETDTDTYDAQERAEWKQGEIVNKGKASGANKKGVSREEVKQAILSSESEKADSLEDVVLPKAQREQARGYYDSMRTGKK